jgi:hypothetical protein
MGRLHIGVEVQQALNDPETQEAVRSVPGTTVVRAFPFSFDTPGLSTSTDHAFVLAASAPTLPVVVVTGANDEFVFTPISSGTPETFTVAAGSYATVALLATAMAAAIGGSAEAFSTIATCANSSGKILSTSVFAGTGDNGDTLTAGVNDVLADLGFASPSTYAGAAIPGVSVYTPTVGDVLIDAWIEIGTAWDGTTPLGDIGTFTGGDYGIWQNLATQPLPMSGADIAGGALGLLSGTHLSDLAQMALVAGISADDGNGLLVAAGAAINLSPTAVSGGFRPLPAKFTTADPIKVCVSQDGTNDGADPASTHGAAVLYLITATPVVS